MNTHRTATFATPAPTRLTALALAAVLTLAMLSGVNVLATSDADQPQLAQATSTSA